MEGNHNNWDPLCDYNLSTKLKVDGTSLFSCMVFPKLTTSRLTEALLAHVVVFIEILPDTISHTPNVVCVVLFWCVCCNTYNKSDQVLLSPSPSSRGTQTTKQGKHTKATTKHNHDIPVAYPTQLFVVGPTELECRNLEIEMEEHTPFRPSSGHYLPVHMNYMRVSDQLNWGDNEKTFLTALPSKVPVKRC